MVMIPILWIDLQSYPEAERRAAFESSWKLIEENEMRDLLPLHTRQGSRIQWLLKTVAIITLHLMMIMNRKIAVIYLWSLGRSEESTLTSAVILLLSSPISMMGSWLQSGDFWTRDPAEVFCWSPFCTTETTQASKVSEDANRLPDIWMGASLQGKQLWWISECKSFI